MTILFATPVRQLMVWSVGWTPPSMFLAQINNPTSNDTPTSILAAVIWLGGVIVAGLLIALRTLWKSGQAKDVEIKALYEANAKLSEQLLREALTAVVDNANRLEDSTKTMEAAMTIIHQVSGHGPSSEQYAQIALLLQELLQMKRSGA